METVKRSPNRPGRCALSRTAMRSVSATSAAWVFAHDGMSTTSSSPP